MIKLEQKDNMIMKNKPKLHYIKIKKPINYYNTKIKVQKITFAKDNILKNNYNFNKSSINNKIVLNEMDYEFLESIKKKHKKSKQKYNYSPINFNQNIKNLEDDKNKSKKNLLNPSIKKTQIMTPILSQRPLKVFTPQKEINNNNNCSIF